MEDRMRAQLEIRRKNGSRRSPLPIETLEQEQQQNQQHRLDFSTNDYLGLAHCQNQKKRVDELLEQAENQSSHPGLGATGSRLLSGDSVYARNLETWLARLHQRQTATLFNSGYDANLSILSSILLKGDLVILDELCHNSIVMGVRMSREQECVTFAHNNIDALERILQAKRRSSSGNCLIVVESVYSMDGDVAPMRAVLDLASRYKADVVVDEAHGLGIYGSTNRQDLNLLDAGTSDTLDYKSSRYIGGTGVLAALGLERHPALLCSVHTFGKASGCHGAIICGSSVLRNYLWNYARPLVYSTAMPLHSLVAIRGSYESMIGSKGEQRRTNAFSLVRLFRKIMSEALVTASPGSVSLWSSPSPIQALVMAGNDTCIQFCETMLERFKIRLYPIRAPTVPVGQERIRIIVHAHNTEREVQYLCQGLLQTLAEMRIMTIGTSKL